MLCIVEENPITGGFQENRLLDGDINPLKGIFTGI